jgi:hypothetical protein
MAGNSAHHVHELPVTVTQEADGLHFMCFVGGRWVSQDAHREHAIV